MSGGEGKERVRDRNVHNLELIYTIVCRLPSVQTSEKF